MIKHIVMFHLKEENKAENIKEALKRLSTFPDEIPTLRGFEAVVNAPEADGTNCDLALVCDFDDMDGLNAYQVHPSCKAPPVPPATGRKSILPRSRTAPLAVI